MNTKRQTVWLVSMLSLMVILSAYYLFTDDAAKDNHQMANGTEMTQDNTTTVNEIVNESDATTESAATGDKSTQGTATDGAATDKAATDKAATDKAATDKAATGDAQTDKSATKNSGEQTKETASKDGSSDQEILDKIESQQTSGQDFFTAYQMKREEMYAQKEQDLNNLMADTSQSDEVLGKAYDDLMKLQDKENKLTNIEETLINDYKYENAVVSEDSDNKFKVVLKSQKLEKSQAVSIVDLVSKKLEVPSYQVAVQIIP